MNSFQQLIHYKTLASLHIQPNLLHHRHHNGYDLLSVRYVPGVLYVISLFLQENYQVLHVTGKEIK